MEHGAVDDAERQVLGIAAARRQRHVDRAQAALAREAGDVVDAEIVALAGHGHVVVAVEPHLARPAGLPCRQRGQRRPLRRLALLAAEAAAHAPHLDGDGVVVEAEDMGDDVLHLARVLGRGMHEHVAVLAGDGQRHLALQVEMLLAAEAELAGHPLGRALQLLDRLAALELVVVEHRGAGDDGIVDVDRRHGRRRRDARQPRRPPGLVARLGDHDEQHLAVEHDLAFGDQRVVADLLGADVVAAGNVLRGQHRDDAGRGAHRLEVERGHAAGGDGRIARRQMQRAGRRAACRRYRAPRR